MLEVWNNPEGIKTLVQAMLAKAHELGASSAEVDVAVNKGFSVAVRQGDVESVEYNQDKAIGITVYFGRRSGSASLSDVRPEAIDAAVRAACNIARFTDEDPYNGLADKDVMAFNYPDLALSHPWEITVEEAIEMALNAEAYALAHDKRIVNSESVSITTTAAWQAYGNSHGFIGIYPVTRHDIGCSLIAKQGEEMQRDYSYSVACDPAELRAFKDVAKEAAERTIRRLGGRRLKTMKVPVIFAAEEARGLIGSFVAAISGSNIYRKSSFLVDELNKPIFPKHITIDERPHLLKNLGSAPFDDDGCKTNPNVFIADGVLQKYALGTYSSRKLGMQATGNAGGVHNLFISTGNKDLPALLKSMGTGLYVTDVMGQGVNLVTGDYSRGASGFWVENGELQYPVEEITIAGNLREMYSQLVEVGTDIDKRGNIQTGSILLESMMVAGD